MQIELVQQHKIYFRLIAIWVFCEAFLGGILHGLKLPITGLLVGSCSVFCISMIAWFVPQKNSLVKATILVAIFKFMLSPHSPITAYVAVFFQGILGSFLLQKKHFLATCILFAIFCLAESALQRILIATFIFGQDFWITINQFFNKLFKNKVSKDYVYFLGIMYIVVHIFWGLLIGIFIGNIPKKIYSILPLNIQSTSSIFIKKMAKNTKIIWWIVWVSIIILFIVANYHTNGYLFSQQIIISIILRGLFIVLSWKLIVSPFLIYYFSQWLQKKRSTLTYELEVISEILPWAKSNFKQSWLAVKTIKYPNKILVFCKQLMVNVLYAK